MRREISPFPFPCHFEIMRNMMFAPRCGTGITCILHFYSRKDQTIDQIFYRASVPRA